MKTLQPQVSYMNNAKWRKFFVTLDRAGVRVGGSRWKFLGSDRFFSFGFPGESDLTDSGIRDEAFFPVEFNWIQSIEIPRVYPDPRSDTERPLPPCTQDIEKIVSILERVGRFPLELKGDSFVVKGYEA